MIIKIRCSRFSYEQNDIIFFISSVEDLPAIEESLHLTTTRVQFIPIINSVISLNQTSLNVWYDTMTRSLSIYMKQVNVRIKFCQFLRTKDYCQGIKFLAT